MVGKTARLLGIARGLVLIKEGRPLKPRKERGSRSKTKAPQTSRAFNHRQGPMKKGDRGGRSIFVAGRRRKYPKKGGALGISDSEFYRKEGGVWMS